MNLRLAAMAGSGIAASAAGGFFIFAPKPVSTIGPGQEKVRMTIAPDGDNAYGDAAVKYGKHLGDRVNDFIVGVGLRMPDEGSGEEVYKSWSGKAGELKKKYIEEFGEEVDDTYLHHENIGGTISRAILRICSGELASDNTNYCMVNRADIR